MDAIAIARDTPLALLVAYILCTDLLTDARSIYPFLGCLQNTVLQEKPPLPRPKAKSEQQYEHYASEEGGSREGGRDRSD